MGRILVVAADDAESEPDLSEILAPFFTFLAAGPAHDGSPFLAGAPYSRLMADDENRGGIILPHRINLIEP